MKLRSKPLRVDQIEKGGKSENHRVSLSLTVYPLSLTLLHSERPKLHTILAFLSAIGLKRCICFRFVKELICVMITSLLSFPLGVVFTAIYYDPLHLYFGLHGEECILCLAAVYGSIVWAADRRTKIDNKKNNETVKGRSFSYTYYCCYYIKILDS